MIQLKSALVIAASLGISTLGIGLVKTSPAFAGCQGVLGCVFADPPLENQGFPTPHEPPSTIPSDPYTTVRLLNIRGRLSSADNTYSDDTFYDSYTFQARRGDHLTITMESNSIDPYLLLFDAAGNKIAWNDDFGSGTNAKIRTSISTSGTYRVVANSYRPSTGSYTLNASVRR